MIAPVNSWVVRAADKAGVVQHEQEFFQTGPHADPDPDPDAAVKARRHYERMKVLYREFGDVEVTLTPSSAPTEERPSV
jgi:hypothetical protein